MHPIFRQEQQSKQQEEHSKHDAEQQRAKVVTGSPNEIVRDVTGQPGQLAAAVPLNQIPSPNQTVRLNISHKTGPEAH